MMLAFDLFEPYGFQFFRNGIVVATVAGALCGLLGVFVVLRGMSYIGHGLSHAVFGGAAASAVIGINFFIGAGIWGIISGVLIARSNWRCDYGFICTRPCFDEPLWAGVKKH
jgi:manganese/iron transport system permease protein/iron/zinc/copper transport system permease protein